MGNVLSFSSVGVVAWLGSLCVALSPIDANAFNSEQMPAATPLHEKANVIVFDDAYLDRRFGRTRVSESSGSAKNSGSATVSPDEPSPALSAFFGGDFIEILPNRSLLKGITRGTSARRAAALRMAENGRQAVLNKQFQKAIYYLEKALGIDASPFVYFYLARAHYQLADYRRSLGFLEVAESGFEGHNEWLPELAALRRSLVASPIAAPPTANARVRWTANE